jgi:hypothetical protein
MRFTIEDCGIDHEQYFPGVGVAYTAWDECYAGIGETLAEAIDDALENAAQDTNSTGARVVRRITDDRSRFTDSELHAPLHGRDDACSADSADCPHHHYAVLFVADDGSDELTRGE